MILTNNIPAPGTQKCLICTERIILEQDKLKPIRKQKVIGCKHYSGPVDASLCKYFNNEVIKDIEVIDD